MNPEHLEAVTCRENILRGLGPGASNARKTHCSAGHPFTEENSYRWRNKKHCRICYTLKLKRDPALRLTAERVEGIQTAFAVDQLSVKQIAIMFGISESTTRRVIRNQHKQVA